MKAVWIFGAIQVLGMLLSWSPNIHDGRFVLGWLFLLPTSLAILAIDPDRMYHLVLVVSVFVNSAAFAYLRRGLRRTV